MPEPIYSESGGVRKLEPLRQKLIIIHGTELDRQSVLLKRNEFYRTTDTGVLWIGDGSTVGGTPVVGSAGIGNDATIAIDETP